MRIAFLLTKFPAISETFILNQITGLIDRGHEVDIFATGGETHGSMHGDIVKYNLLERTHYRCIPKNKLIRLGSGAGHLMNSFPQRTLPLLKSLNILKLKRKALTMSLFYAALSFIGKGPYDIIHCHFGENGNLGVQLRDIGALKGKLVVTFHGHDVTSYPQVYGKDVYKDLFSKADLVTINSNFIRNKVKALGCDEDKIVKLPVGLNTSEFFFMEKKPCPKDGIKLLTVGRLVEKKGIEYSIAAVAEVMKAHPNIRYSIAGDGKLRYRLEQLIAKLGVGDRVKLLGWKNQDEMLQLYAESHIFILSSVTADNGDQEGQGLVLQEAQAMGLPVIATLHNGFPDSVIKGKSAFLVPERDINALAERIEYLVEHPGLWPEMGLAGRKFVEERFDSDKLNDKLVCLYQKLVNEDKQIYRDKLIIPRSV